MPQRIFKLMLNSVKQQWNVCNELRSRLWRDERERVRAGDQLLIFSFDDHLTKYLWWQNNVRNSFMNVIVSAANDQFLVGYVCGAVVRLLTAPGWLAGT